jgi:hypothetical protein
MRQRTHSASARKAPRTGTLVLADAAAPVLSKILRAPTSPVRRLCARAHAKAVREINPCNTNVVQAVRRFAPRPHGSHAASPHVELSEFRVSEKVEGKLSRVVEHNFRRFDTRFNRLEDDIKELSKSAAESRKELGVELQEWVKGHEVRTPLRCYLQRSRHSLYPPLTSPLTCCCRQNTLMLKLGGTTAAAVVAGVAAGIIGYELALFRPDTKAQTPRARE